MSIVSSAVGGERLSRILGYAIEPEDFRLDSPNLPQRIAILAEANSDNQDYADNKPYQLISQKNAGDRYGYGSPIHQIMRILKPTSGEGVGGIPIFAYPQAQEALAVAEMQEITVSNNATGNNRHFVRINGRTSIDGESYGFDVVEDDTPTLIALKIKDAIANVLAAPCKAGVPTAGVLPCTAKWKGVTGQELTIDIDTNGDAVGVLYAVAQDTAGAGLETIDDALAEFQQDWNTLVINSYGATYFDELEAFNGKPDPTSPTGRYAGILFKPFMALWGSKEATAATLAAITNTDTRKVNLTNALAPAPNSEGFTWEAAANGCYLAANVFQNTPHLDVSGRSYPAMPVPVDGLIGDMSDYDQRDFLVKNGASTVTLEGGAYKFQDFVTTYHPVGENPAQFRYPRVINIHFNFKYGYRLLELQNVIDHTILENDQPSDVGTTIKPKQWKGILFDYFDDLAKRALISDPDFSKDNTQVGTDGTNPDRLNTTTKYKSTPIVRIASSTISVGFAFGIE